MKKIQRVLDNWTKNTRKTKQQRTRNTRASAIYIWHSWKCRKACVHAKWNEEKTTRKSNKNYWNYLRWLKWNGMAAKSLCFRAEKMRTFLILGFFSVFFLRLWMCNFRMQLKSFLKFTKITLKLVKLFVNERRNDCVRIDYTNQHTADESQNFTQ